MNRLQRMTLAAALLLLSAPLARAQTADPSGHWQGSLQIPGREVTFEIDLARNGTGDFAGTTSLPAEGIKGLPLRSVVVAGASVSFDARRDQPFRGVLSADGKSISGDATLSGYVLPFSMVRTGDAEIARPAKSAPIGRDLEGTWDAAFEDSGATRHIVLTMTNHADGTATGRLINTDEGGLEIPLVIAQKASNVTLETTVLKGMSFSGALNADGTELSGAITQGSMTVPVTFRRAAK